MSDLKFLASGALLFAITLTATAQTTKASVRPPTVEQAVTVFLTAFENLDWPVFRECFSRDATVFHPAAPNVKRIDSERQFQDAWLGVFERIRKSSGRTGPPFMRLQPQDLLVQRLSDDVAIVTFHLTDGNVLNRRTLVFKRLSTGWKIVHLHASNLIVDPGSEIKK